MTQGGGHFWAQENNLNKLGKGPIGDFFYGSPYISLCKTCDPWGGAIFGPNEII